MAMRIAWGRADSKDRVYSDSFGTHEEARRALASNCSAVPRQKWQKMSEDRYERKLPDCTMVLEIVSV
jgi:hypothetical protein